MKKDMPDGVRPYSFFDVELLEVGTTESVGVCPYCLSRKFFISSQTSQYDCKKCGETGNKYTFFQHIASTLDRTSVMLAKVCKYRKSIPTTGLLKKTRNVGVDANGTVCIVHRNPGKKNPVNIRKWDRKKNVLYNAPGCCSLYFQLWNTRGPIFLCEGEWDAIAFNQLLINAKWDLKKKPVSILAVPGATTFKESWKKWFNERELILLYDNDDAGRKGIERVTEILDGAESINQLNWDDVKSNLPDKYDISDWVQESIELTKPRKYLKQVMDSVSTVKAKRKKIKLLKRTSFDAVVNDFKKSLEFNQSFIDVLACCYATIVTLYMSHQKKNPLWMFVVAPASSGKTTIIETFDAATEYTKQVSKLTPASLVTGLNLRTESEDPSLLNILRDNVLFIKDFTPVLTMGGDKETIFGILRDAYDGAYIARYASGVREYRDLYFGIVAGVTHAIERVNMTDLGERFLRIRLIDDDFDELAHIEKALRNVDTVDSSVGDISEYLKGAVTGFLHHLIENIYQPEYPDKLNRKLAPLAQFTALCRASVPRSTINQDMYYRPLPEVASRIATQLKKLGLGLAMVYDKPFVDKDCYRVMKKVAFDSCVGWKLELIQTLGAKGKPMTVRQLSNEMQIQQGQVRKIIDDAQQLGMVEHIGVESKKGRGPKARKYTISRSMQTIIEQAEIVFTEPSHRTYTPANKRESDD